MAQRIPLYVRLPAPAAEKLDKAAFERKTSKQDLVAGLVDMLDDSLTVGRHSFRPNTADVLTAEEAADLLRLDEEAVLASAEAGDLPGRKIGDEWRFSRAALLEWLGGD